MSTSCLAHHYQRHIAAVTTIDQLHLSITLTLVAIGLMASTTTTTTSMGYAQSQVTVTTTLLCVQVTTMATAIQQIAHVLEAHIVMILHEAEIADKFKKSVGCWATDTPFWSFHPF